MNALMADYTASRAVMDQPDLALTRREGNALKQSEVIPVCETGG